MPSHAQSFQIISEQIRSDPISSDRARRPAYGRSDQSSRTSASDRAPLPDRPAGTVHRTGGKAPHNPREAVVDALHGLPRYAVRDRFGMEREAGKAYHPRAAEFCLAPGGQLGGFGSRGMEAMAANCVPVVVDDAVATVMEEARCCDTMRYDAM